MTRFPPTLVLLAVVALGACSREHRDDEGFDDFRPPMTQTRAEFTERLGNRFDRLDRNRDGVIGTAELTGRRGARAAGFDTNGNGEITRGEFTTGSLARFDAQDTNHDGSVTSAEVKAWRAANPLPDDLAPDGNTAD